MTTPTMGPLPAGIVEIQRAFRAAGRPLYVVGGAVRDSIMGLAPKDYDLATDAEPNRVIEILKDDYNTSAVYRWNWQVDLTGKAFGVVRVKSHYELGVEYEIATFRKDVGSGRRPDSVVFTSIEEDVKRRDLTVNALFYNIDTKTIVDLVGGVDDIKNMVIRTVGDPHERFAEDPLRILRALRFAARPHWVIDPATSDALRTATFMGVSRERIHDELVRGFKGAQSTRRFLDLYATHDVWKDVFPSLRVDTGCRPPSRDLPVVLSRVLAGNPTRHVQEALHDACFTAVEVAQTVFFMDFKDLSVESALRMARRMESLRIKKEQLIDYRESCGMPSQDLLGAFLLYRPTVKGDDLLAQGYSGAGLGRELELRERELFGRLVSCTG